MDKRRAVADLLNHTNEASVDVFLICDELLRGLVGPRGEGALVLGGADDLTKRLQSLHMRAIESFALLGVLLQEAHLKWYRKVRDGGSRQGTI